MKTTICSLVVLLIFLSCSTIFSQTQTPITETILDNFYEYHSEIKEYFMYCYDDKYSNDMLYYIGRLETIIPNMIERNMVSDDIFDLLIKLYRDTLSLRVPKDEKDMYIEAGLGENGHNLYTKIFSIWWFMDIEKISINFLRIIKKRQEKEQID